MESERTEAQHFFTSWRQYLVADREAGGPAFKDLHEFEEVELLRYLRIAIEALREHD